MAKVDPDALVRLDLNNRVFQENLLSLQKPERHAALDTLNKIRQLTWNQLYRDNGLKWEKVISVKPPAGVDAIYCASPGHAGQRHSATAISFACSPSRQTTTVLTGKSKKTPLP